VHPRSSLAVRIVLSLCLVLNGFEAGSAAHAQRMSDADVTAGPAVDQPATADGPAQNAEPPCHGAHVGQSTAPPAQKHDLKVSTSDLQHGCCDQAGCGGSCLHQPTGPVPFSTSVVIAAPTAAAVAPRALHIAPALPHLTRPPIG